MTRVQGINQANKDSRMAGEALTIALLGGKPRFETIKPGEHLMMCVNNFSSGRTVANLFQGVYQAVE
jgi:hypothetical protein